MSNFNIRFDKLRGIAEQILKEQPNSDRVQPSKEDVNNLIHEIQVYQTELEIQNEELRHAQQSLETSRNQYSWLFYQAPVGYMTIDKQGRICQANDTIATLLDRDIATLTGRAFFDFIHPDDQAAVIARFHPFCNNPERKYFEVRLHLPPEKETYVHIVGKKMNGSLVNVKAASQPVVILSFTDVTAKKEKEILYNVLNNVLNSTLEIRKLIPRTQTIDEQIEMICKTLTQSFVFESAWITLTDDEQVIHSAESGFNDSLRRLLLEIECNDTPRCINQALESESTVLLEDDRIFCESCPVAAKMRHHAVYASRLSFRERVYGILCISAPHQYAKIGEIKKIISEVADDISLSIDHLLSDKKRIEAEHRLEITNNQLIETLNSISDGFIGMDEQLVVHFINQASEKLLLKKAEEVVGKELFEAFPDARGSVFEEKYRYVLEHKCPLSFEVFFEGDPITNWYSVRVFPKKDGIAVFFQVVTESKKSQERLRFQATLLESVRESIVATDLQGSILYWGKGAEDLYGYREDEVLGRNVTIIAPATDKQEEEKRMRIVNETGVWSGQYEQQRKDGTRFIAETVISLMYDENGNKIGFIGVDRDITDRIAEEENRLKLERQIQHAQKLESLGVLAGGIAHDFNNILMAILGNADLALLELSPLAPALPHIQQITIAARRASELSKQMLAYSGKGKFVVDIIDLNNFIEEMAHLLSVSVSKNVVLKYNFAENLPPIEGDITQIRQVIMNLITNASEAIGQKSGFIVISTGAMDCDNTYLSEFNPVFRPTSDTPLPEGMYVYFEVTDTGCGMTKDTMDKMFDPFFTTKFTGRGLGMAAVLGIMRGHSGALKVYSEVGKGTTFKVLFPVSTSIPSVTNALTEKQSLHHHPLSGTVLVVDDEETVRTIAKKFLMVMGLDVITAEDGRVALELYKKNADRICFVLLDMTMPHMDGEQTFRELRRINKDVKVILCSGYNEQETTQRFVGKGLAGFVQKPYQIADIKKMITKILQEPPETPS
jgi:PAS domain S-box-containing protein